MILLFYLIVSLVIFTFGNITNKRIKSYAALYTQNCTVDTVYFSVVYLVVVNAGQTYFPVDLPKTFGFAFHVI